MPDKPIIKFDHRDRDEHGYHDWAEQSKEELSVKADIEIGHMPLGDIEWSGGGRSHLAEIKHVGDLMDSFAKGHLQDQITRMIVWNEKKHEGTAGLYLLIAGRFTRDNNGYVSYSRDDWYVPGFSKNSIGQKIRNEEEVTWQPAYRPYAMLIAYLASIQGQGITVLWTAPNEFGTTFGALYRWTAKKFHNRKIRRATVIPAEQQALMALSPKLTQVAAKRLLVEFGDVIGVVSQETDTLVQVPGIGPVTAQEIEKNARRSHG